MAITRAGAKLTEAHRRAQLAVRSATLRDLLRIWPAWDVNAYASTWPPVEAALVPLIQHRGSISAGLAASYYTDFRSAEGIDGTGTPRVAPLIPVDDITAVLRRTGPANVGRLLSVGRRDAMAVALTDTSGEATRLVLGAGRDTLHGSIDADPKAHGYARVTDRSPCSFCAMLASRGAVYRSRQTAEGKKYHGHCGCTAEPVYDLAAPPPPGADKFAALWNESTKGRSGREARIAFRRAIEGR